MSNILKSESIGSYLIKACIVFALHWGAYLLISRTIGDTLSSIIGYQALNILIFFVNFLIAMAVVKKIYPALAILYIIEAGWFIYYSAIGFDVDVMYMMLGIASYTVFGVIYLMLPISKKTPKSGTNASSKKTDGTYPSNF